MFKWKAAYAQNCVCADWDIKTSEDIEKIGLNVIDAVVPGNAELDLMRAGLVEDLYYSDNTLLAQRMENLHAWYFCEFEVNKPSYLHFGGIDTIADIYVNGKLVGSASNMFIGYDFYPEFENGKNELLVHIKPVCIEARKYTLPVSSNSQQYSYQSLYVRKAAHMYGWDIMPRIVSAGIWKDVELLPIESDKIKEVFFVTNKIEDGSAQMRFYINADISGDFVGDYSVRIKGACGDSKFEKEEKLWHNSYQFAFEIENVKPWWPKNAGAANLYDTSVELLYNGEVCDTYNLSVGVRTVELIKSDGTDKDGNGEFCFKVNGKKIFVLGTNWVPLDAFHSNDIKRLPKALELLDDIGCNMVRCWGGNVYESDEFFDFCDKKGIMVWQDFAMGCSVYPQEKRFADMLSEEVIYQIKRLRNHASLTLWAGDNECDLSYESWSGFIRDPNNNFLTRETIKRLIDAHDYTRPYLASSPFVSEAAHAGGLTLPEDHLWGPRDYFKGDFYKNSLCHFASETGYHGMPSPESLRKFLRNPEKIFEENFKPTDEYLVHAASMELDANAPYAFRIKLAYDQVVTLFGKAEEDISDYIKQSQISQAEAKKYFIERFRIAKWKKTGIIWWNLIDGWPQVSDAVVDYYYTKKLAYHYIKRSQNPICFMFDEPCDNMLSLFEVNDTTKEAEASYVVTDVIKNKTVMKGSVRLAADSSVKVGKMKIGKNEKKFYLIKWTVNGKTYKNHYYTNIIDISYSDYTDALKLCGFDEFEGF